MDSKYSYNFTEKAEQDFDEILRYGSEQEKRKLFEQNRKDIQKITDRVHRIAADEHTVRRRAI